MFLARGIFSAISVRFVAYHRRKIMEIAAARAPLPQGTEKTQECPDSQSAASVVQLPVKLGNRKKSENRPPFKSFSKLEPLKTPSFLNLAPKPIRYNLTRLKRIWIRQQFADAFRNQTEAEVRNMLEKLLQSEVVQNADLFMEELVRHKLKNLDFGNAFSAWSNYAQMERSIAGVDQLLEFVLRNDKDILTVQQARIKRICVCIQRLFTSSVAFAECVSAYLITGKDEEARALARYYVIAPRSFIGPVKRLGEKGDIKNLERFAQLINHIYHEDVIQKEAKEEVPDPAVEHVKFLLQTHRRKKKNYAAKEPKVKRYEVDHRQLEILMKTLDKLRLVASTRR